MADEADFLIRQSLVEERLQADSSEAERQLFLAAEVGDIEVLKDLIESGAVSVECENLSGRSAIEIAVDASNEDIMEYLLPKCKPETIHRALLCAVESDKNHIFELILQHPIYTIQKSGTANGTARVSVEAADTGDEKPYQFDETDDTVEEKKQFRAIADADVLLREALVFAAIECNFPIVRSLVLRGAYIESPHDYFCLCKPCAKSKSDDMMYYTKRRLNTYKALASPAYISVTERDPIIAAFHLSYQFRKLTEIEIEYKQTYLELDAQCQQFSIGLIDQCRSSEEVSTVLSGKTTDLDGDGDADIEEEDDILPLLKLAMRLDQKRFVAHPSCQAQMAQLWFSGVPFLRYLNRFSYLVASIPIGIVLVPILSVVYLVAPWSNISVIMNTPIMRFVSYTCSYITFLILVMAAKLNLGMSMNEIGCDNLSGIQQTIFFFLLFWLFGLVWEESKQLYDQGGKEYFSSFWNVMDTIMLCLYMCTFGLEIVAPRALRRLYDSEYEVTGEPQYCDQLRLEPDVCDNPIKALQPTLVWEPKWMPDPSMLSDVTFSIAVLMSIGRFSFIMPSNEQFGTMLVSFRRTGSDIFKLCSMFILVLIAFACGMAVLYGAESCNNVHFTTLGMTSQTLIWAMFGMGDSEFTDIENDGSGGSFTLRAYIISNIGSVLFAIFVFATAVVLMNLLIAMMANTFQEIQDERDTEWKFGRTELWLNFIEPGSAVPPPFNIIPSTKSLLSCCFWAHSKITSSLKIDKGSQLTTFRKNGYNGFGNDSNAESRQQVLSTLVRRYVRKMERERMEQDEDSTKDELLRRALDRVIAKLEKRFDQVDDGLRVVLKDLGKMVKGQDAIAEELKRIPTATGQ